MNIKKTNTYTLIKPLSDFTTFFSRIKSSISDFDQDNLIIDLSTMSVNSNELNKFSEISEKKQESGTSFVVIFKEINLDLIDDELVVVPSFQEALDMIEMDEITRSLDF